MRRGVMARGIVGGAQLVRSQVLAVAAGWIHILDRRRTGWCWQLAGWQRSNKGKTMNKPHFVTDGQTDGHTSDCDKRFEFQLEETPSHENTGFILEMRRKFDSF